MTLIIQKPTGGKLVMRKGWQPMDSDAATYIAAVEAADGQPLEEKTKIAIDNFVLGCKADGIWSAIKASCIMAGARTLSGALVPLVGTAPTNNNFVDGDYNRKTGLVGNGSTKYLNSNRNNNADPQNSKHLAAYISERAAGTNLQCGSKTESGATYIRGSTDLITSLHSSLGATAISNVLNINSNFVGVSRDSSSFYRARAASRSAVVTSTSVVPSNANIDIHRRGEDLVYGNCRLAFYSIGESLDLALLDARVTDLINAFGAAIP